MHILVAILTVLGAVAVWYYRLRMIGGAAKEIGRAAEGVINAPRKFAFMQRARQNGLKGVEDPREAAAILLALVAGVRRGEAIGDEARATIIAETSQQFELDEEEAEALVTHAAWMVRDVDVPLSVAATMSRTIINTPGIGPKELVDLDSMLVAVSEAGGPPQSDQLQLLQAYRDRAGLRA